jgi:hypothetical protein
MAYSWNAQSDEELARLWAAGHTTMQIAAAFGVTKNSWLSGANAPQGAALLNLMKNNEEVAAEMARLMKMARGDD